MTHYSKSGLLRDCIRAPVRVLFVGINPGIRSSMTGHHFAGVSNRFWKLLSQSRGGPQPNGDQDDSPRPAGGLTKRVISLVTG